MPLNSYLLHRQKSFTPANVPNLAAWMKADERVYQDAAVQFTAADKSWLQIADASQTGLDPGTDDFLIAGWFKHEGLSSSYGRIYDKDGAFALSINALRQLYARINWGGGALDTTPSAATVIAANTWAFVAVYYDRDGNMTLYINGDSVATTSISGGSASAVGSATAFTLGYGVGSIWWGGAADSLMFFKAADLSAVASDIITWAYNGGAGRLCSEATAAQKTAWGAISGWEMSEPTGRRYDSWGSNHLDQAFSNIIQPTTYGADSLTNGNLDAWTTGDPDGWTKSNLGTGAIDEETTIVNTTGVGVGAARITTGDNNVIRLLQVKAALAAGTYRYSFWTRGDGTYGGRYKVLGSTTGDLVGLSNTNVNGTNYTLVVADFVVPSAQDVTLYLYGNATSGAVIYFDDISLKAVTTPAINNGGFENWTVPSAAELVVNGNFTGGITGWTNHASYPWDTFENGDAGTTLHVVSDGSGSAITYSTEFGVTSGAVYRIRYSVTKNSGANLTATCSSAIVPTSIGYGVTHSATNLTVDTYFTATETDAQSYLTFSVGASAADWTIDNVSITQVPSNADTWVEDGVNRPHPDADTPSSGSYSLRLDVDAAGGTGQASLACMTVGKLYSWSMACKVSDESGSNEIYHPITAATYLSLTNAWATYSGTSRADTTSFKFSRYSATGKAVYCDGVTLAAAEILAAPGIARSVATDSNFATQLNGTSQYYSRDAIQPGTGDFAYFGCFYVDALPTAGAFRSIVWSGVNGGDQACFGLLFDSTGKLDVYFNHTDGASTHKTGGTVVAGQWYTFAVNHDRDADMILYLDAVATITHSIATRAGECDPSGLYLGKYYTAAYYHAGRLDNIGYANRLLTAPEITFLHNNGEWRQWSELGVAGTDGSALTSSVVQGFWDFDDVSFASAAVDSSGNGNNLTSAGTPTRGNGINYYAGQVSRWEDRSGNANHATQSTLAKRPSYMTNVTNGKPAIYFDGVDDLLAANGIATSLTGSDKPFTIIMALKMVGTGTDQVLWSLGKSDSATQFHELYNNATGPTWSLSRKDDAGTRVDAAGGTPNTNASIISIVFTGTTTSLWANGTLAIDAAAQDVTAMTVNQFAWGCLYRTTESSFGNFYLYEAAVYSRALSDGERIMVQRYLGNKYALAV